MSELCAGGLDEAPRGNAAALRAANRLYLAAAPMFAIMALVTAILDEGSSLCSVASPSVLSGMVPMYLLMSTFHLPPWLKLIASRR